MVLYKRRSYSEDNDVSVSSQKTMIWLVQSTTHLQPC